MSPNVSLIVINYNGMAWIDDCLRSIMEQDRPAQEVVVVDNASSDGSAERVARQWPQVRLLQLSRNVGFAAACNRGIKAASGELVGILNNDLILARDWLKALLQEVRPPWDLWASRIVLASQPARLDSAGDGMGVVGAAYKHGHGQPASQYSQSREVFSPCAAAALYRRSLLEKLGGFDEDFFLIYEDADLGFRARLAGHRCYYAAGAEVRHRVNASIGRLSESYVYYGRRNSSYLFWKNMPWPLLLLYLPERFLFECLAAGYFTLKGRGWTVLRAKFDVLRNFPALMRKRRKVQALRTVSAGRLRRQLTRNWLKGRLKPTGES
ncbi:MAG TPA: glycosyltransferase family 2 protein [Acidobacteriota bacterium]|nr:glycosyltransferase family 2 protein [Acidobacteriota bacterium]